ncbi:hypothetical protein AVEN_124537-1 [Araneus ventricosus]|uniref:Uncharacterized protein n=1 Tax=Araneus ventricosus TaxID=182803 RepID=A0A4Y2WH57_ARAVE|nr:hypothetical protein AVEN_124537-1 [Araneus ventricosus]
MIGAPRYFARDVYAYLMSRTTVYRHFFARIGSRCYGYLTRYSNFGPTFSDCASSVIKDDTREAQQYVQKETRKSYGASSSPIYSLAFRLGVLTLCPNTVVPIVQALRPVGALPIFIGVVSEHIILD